MAGEKFARVAFVNKATGALLEGEHIADTGPTWLVKPESGAPVQALSKDEWTSVPPRERDPFGGIFSMFGGGR